MCIYLYIFFSRSATEELYTQVLDVVHKRAYRLESNPLNMSAAKKVSSPKFLGSRFGVVVQLKDKRQESHTLRRRVSEAETRAKTKWGLHTQGLPGNLPEGAAKKVVLDLIGLVTTSKDAPKLGGFVHSPGSGPPTDKALENTHRSVLLAQSQDINKFADPVNGSTHLVADLVSESNTNFL